MTEMLSILNEEPLWIDGPGLLHDLVATVQDPEAIAIDYAASGAKSERVTYTELHERSERLASKLRTIWNRTARSNDARFIVPLYMPQCPDLYISQVAILEAGGAFCPISLDVPEERLRFILDDVGAEILLTTEKLKHTLPALHGVSIVPVDNHFDPIPERSRDIPSMAPSSPAYIMYTSGSTGLPKGVIISHSAAAQALLAHDRHIPSFSRFLQFASPTFDVSVFEIFFPLFRGSTLVCGERGQLLTDLPGFIGRMRVDAAELTPSVASSLLRGRKSVPGLHCLLTIGEMLRHDVVGEFGGSDKVQSALHGMYGPTEATIHCTLQTHYPKDMPVGNIGIPLDTVSAFIVKPSGEDSQSPVVVLPVGEDGELAVGGHQLADGYLNREEQTRTVFVHHPKYGRLYRTGDRARLNTAGRLECLGRISSGQVKLRGQRVELGEIEHAASQTVGCRSVVADVVSGTLVAFCVPESTDLTRRDIQECCRQWVPAFMVPGDILFVDALPLSAAGKVDRKALQNMYLQRADMESSTAFPITPRLQSLIDTIGAALQVTIRPETQLAAVGLDSLSSIRIASALRKAGFSSVDASILLEAHTPEDIESALSKIENQHENRGTESPVEQELSALQEAVNAHPLVTGLIDKVECISAPTSVQSAMLLETARDRTAYCNWISFVVNLETTATTIQACLAQLAQLHPTLRSGFVPLNDARHMHAVVTWKELLSDQIRLVETSDHAFTISADQDLLRPCDFQIVKAEPKTYVLMRIHHALYDQWSIDVLKRDLALLLQGQTVDQPLTFRAVSRYHQAYSSAGHHNASLDFWRDTLRQFSPALLPPMNSKRVAPGIQRTEWTMLDLDIASLRRNSASVRCSVPAMFQAAFTYLLGCYTGTTDVTFGSVFSGRHLPLDGTDGVFGPCLATLPLRIEYAATRTCRDLMRLVHDRNRAAQKHSLTPLADVKSAAGLDSDQRLFDVLFIWQESTLPQDDGNEDGVVLEVDSKDHSEFNLVLEFEPKLDSLQVRATFQQSLIGAPQIEVLLKQISHISTSMGEHPESLTSNLATFLPNDVLSMWNTEPTYCAPGHSLIQAIEDHARTSPSDPALVFAHALESEYKTETLDYQDLNAMANKMAHFLRTKVTEADELVCICMEKSIHLYVAILASLKAGLGYLPLLPETPPARAKSIIKQSHVNICICDGISIDLMRSTSAATVLDIYSLDLEPFSGSNVQTTMSPFAVAYTVFTSGSTGEPKGVAVTLENLLGNLQALAELYHVQAGGRLLQACSQAFDVSVFEILFSFYQGICLCSATKEVLFQDIEASIRALKVTHLSLTPTVAALIEPSKVPDVNFLVTAGEGVTDLVHAMWAGKGLHQGYGPSETTNVCTVNMNVCSEDVLGNIGQPFRNTSAFVVTEDFRVLPVGAVGEFAFGGEQVFKGYVDMPGLNAEKIIEHPQFGRLYRSGDVGRILHDGTMLISGRLDDQVKIRGNRIELGEINATLLRDSAVLDCTTLVLGSGADQELAAFVVLSSTLRANQAVEVLSPDHELIEHLFELLEDAVPSYMIPTLVVPVTRLPLTVQSKLDRRCLRDMLSTLDIKSKGSFFRNQDGVEDEEQWSDLERRIATTLANGLAIQPSIVSRNGSFFALGLNSLSAISFSRNLTKTWDVPVNPGIILRNPSVARLARSFNLQPREPQPGDDSCAMKGLPDDVLNEASTGVKQLGYEVEEFLPCTPLQEAMLSSAATSDTSYCNTTWLTVAGDLQSLKQCWQQAVARHAILRTKFFETSSSDYPYVQAVVKDHTLRWKQHNKHPTSVPDLIDIDNTAPFAIEVYATRSSLTLALRMHHAIYDGVSLSQLINEVERLYLDLDLPPTVPFRPFLDEVQRQSGPKAMSFWSSQVRDFQPMPFPQASDAVVPNEHCLMSRLSIYPTEVDSYCQRHAVTPLAVFQAGLIKTISILQNSNDVCVGNVVSGRSLPIEGLEKLVAPCFNTIPIRMRLDSIRSNLHLVKSLLQHNVDAIHYELSPLRRIQALSANPAKRLFNALLLLQPSPLQTDGSIWELEREEGSMNLPLVLEIKPLPEVFDLSLHHLQHIIAEPVAVSISEAFSAALADILEYPLSDVAHSTDADQNLRGILAPSEPVLGTNEHSDGDNNLSVGAWTDNQAIVRDVLADIAKVDARRILQNTSMYQLGLDSLNAPQVAAKLRLRKVNVDAADVMEALTPAAIAETANKDVRSSPNVDVDLETFDRKHRAFVLSQLPPQHADIEKIRPCTSVQSGMIAQSRRSHGNLYINHVTYKMPEGTTLRALNTAWSALCRKHELLRSILCQIEDSQTPFALAVLSEAGVPNSIAYITEEAPLDTIEKHTQERIAQETNKVPWYVTMSSTNGQPTMTLSIHHALYDAESLQIMLSDLESAFRGEPLGRTIDVDTILSSMLVAERQASIGDEAFWIGALQNATIAKFPDLAPHVVTESVLSVEEMTCNVHLSTFNRFCQTQGVTIQAIGQTIWAFLLAAYIGDAKVTFGTVFSGRISNASWQTAFPCISTIPVPCDTSEDMVQAMQNMVDYNAIAQRHRFTPAADVQRFAGHPGRPLFDTVFVYQKGHTGTHSPHWSIVRETAGVDYTLSLELENNEDGGLLSRLTFDTARVPLQQAHAMLLQYRHLLKRLVQGSDYQPSPTETLYSVSPAREPELPSGVELLHEFVERGAALYPETTAFSFVHGLDDKSPQTKEWTYRQLDEIGNQIAHQIQATGCQQNGVVAVCMNKCPEATFSFIGILKAGCSFLALDPELPQSRLDFILQDSGSSILLKDPSTRHISTPNNVVNLEIVEHTLEGLPKRRVKTQKLSSEATCYCLYTSGTTGTPKGCEITHRNAVQAMLSFQRLFAGHWTQNSRWLQFASYWFDVSVLEQFWSWSVGISVVGAPRDLVLEDLTGFIRALKITHIDLTPSLARLVQPEDVPSLWGGVFITGGEALKQEIIDAWGPKHTVCNGYGPTEATIGVTMNTFIGPQAKPSNIGGCFDNVGAYVLRAESEETVLQGAVGELCVSGLLVGKGYLSRPDLTAKQFPFLKRHGERVYRTGDLVRLLADGSFQFLGRQDTQAKLRGQRLEIAEIDAVIQQSMDEVPDVASLVVKDNAGKETLVSFVASTDNDISNDIVLASKESGRQLSTAARKACEQKLPTYMVPTHIIPLNRLPLTVNNKVDTKRLVSLFDSLPMKQLQELKQPRDIGRPLKSMERRTRKVLGQMFAANLDRVGAQTNLFSIGLSSISAISFASLLKRAGMRKANVAVIMKCQTLEQLAKALEGSSRVENGEKQAVDQTKLSMRVFARHHTNAAARVLSVDVRDIETVAPCTPLQQGLILESLRSAEKPYFNDFRYVLHDIDLSRLRLAFQSLVNEVQVLRSALVNLHEGYTQVVRKGPRVTFNEWSVSNAEVFRAMKKQKLEWMSHNNQDICQPFEVHVFESPGDKYLVLHLHHALYDGISFDLLMKRLWTIYDGEQPAEGPANFTDALPYGPLLKAEGAESFWRQRLDGCSFTPLPGRIFGQHSSDVMAQQSVPGVELLEQKRQELGVSHQAVIQACFEIAVCQQMKSPQTYGVVVSGRSVNLEGAEGILGPMFNTIPLPLSVQCSLTLAEHIENCHQTNADALPFQHTPLRDIRKWFGIRSGQSMFDILFVFQYARETNSQHGDHYCTQIVPRPKAEFPLVCEVEMHANGGLMILLLAQGDILGQDDLDALMLKLQHALSCVIDNTHAHLEHYFGIEQRIEKHSRPREEQGTPFVNGVSNFEWTTQATVLRQTIVQLLDIDPEQVDEHTSIFSLGLDSIDAVKLSSRLRTAGLLIPVSHILRAQTIPRMLELLRTGSDATRGTTRTNQSESIEQVLWTSSDILPKVEKADVEKILPATPLQEALVADMLRSELREYFNTDVLRLKENVQVDRLQAAWDKVVQSSPILRTSFTEVTDPSLDASFAQVVHRPGPFIFDEVQYASIHELELYHAQIRKEVSSNIQHRPPFRLAVATIGAERYLVISIAHAMYDGHSLALLHEDVQRAYTGTFENRPSNDFAVEAAIDATGDTARQFWINMLSGAKALRISQVTNATPSTETNRAQISSTLPIEELRSFCQNHNITMQTLAQTCWSLTLAHHTRSLDVLFGVVLACRDSAEAEQVMFPMMNTVVTRAQLHGTRAEMLQHMQSVIASALPYQRTPLRLVQRACADVVDTTGSLPGSGLFDTLIIYQHKPTPSENADEALYDSVGGDSSVDYPVAVEMEVTGDQLNIRAACKGEVMDHAATVQLVQEISNVLDSLIARPQEATVHLQDGKASICGMTPFEVQDNELEQVKDDDEPSDVKTELIFPETTVQISKALARVSGIEVADVDPGSTIESIGVDSISAIKVASILRKAGIKLTVSDIVRSRTPARMAALVSAESSAQAANVASSKEVVEHAVGSYSSHEVASRAGVDPDVVECVLPATAGQVYMLSMWQKTHGQLFYSTFTYQIKGEVTKADIEQAWEALVERYNILRTVFVETGDRKCPALQLVIARNDFSGYQEQPTQPMVTLNIIKTDASHEFVLKIHHALYDAVSLPILIEDLARLLANTPSVQPQATLQDLIATSVCNESSQRQKLFWQQYLDMAAPMSLAQPSAGGPQTKIEIFRPGLLEQNTDLETLVRRSDMSTQALLFAAYAKVYATLAASKITVDESQPADVILGIYLSNRSHLPDLDRLAAPTLNLVPLLVRSPQHTSLLDVAKQVQSDLLEISTPENSATGLWAIADWTDIKVDTFVNFLKLPDRDTERVQSRSIEIVEVGDHRVQERTEVVQAGADQDFEVPKGLEGLAVTDVYRHSLDIEMTMAQGKLDVGLFAPVDMIDLEQADELLDEMRSILLEFMGNV